MMTIEVAYALFRDEEVGTLQERRNTCDAFV